VGAHFGKIKTSRFRLPEKKAVVELPPVAQGAPIWGNGLGFGIQEVNTGGKSLEELEKK